MIVKPRLAESRGHRPVQIKMPFVAVDWGTSKMRAWLCDRERPGADAAAVITGPGIAGLERPPADVLFAAIAPWTREHGKLDILLGGMAGSNIGWRATPYLSCPLHLEELARSLLSFEEAGHQVLIVPGVSCTNRLGQPDVMRGEEVQLLGCLRDNPAANNADAVLCLPGTHTKWVVMSGGQLTSFTTSITGELYAMLRERSVLVPRAQSVGSPAFDAQSFADGVDAAAQSGDDLLHLLFSTRSRTLLDLGGEGDALSYLSGLLIATDIRSGLRGCESSGTIVELIGALQLCDRFATAAARLGFASRVCNGDVAVLAGLRAIAEGDAE